MKRLRPRTREERLRTLKRKIRDSRTSKRGRALAAKIRAQLERPPVV